MRRFSKVCVTIVLLFLTGIIRVFVDLILFYLEREGKKEKNRDFFSALVIRRSVTNIPSVTPARCISSDFTRLLRR